MNKDYFNDDFSEGSSFSSPGTEQALLERSQLQARVDTEPKVEEFQIRSIKLRVDEDFPISLDIEAEVNNILAAGIFRQLENPALYDKISDLMLSPVYCELVKMLFWTVFVVKFQKEEAELLDKLRKRLGSLYSEFFTRMQQPKEELSNIGIIGAAYLCHIVFFNLFPKEREMFDMRFILDCYHVVIHEVNGIFVSDFYIQTSIERLFGNKFFHYEKRVEKKKKVEKRDYRNEPLLRDLEFDLKDLPQVPGGLDLAYELSSKLRKVPRKQRTINTHDSVESNRGNLPGNRAIMRLTQQPEEKSILSKSEEVGAYFPKLKFNCHQISPTVSSFLESSTSVLPFQKRKVINYSNNKHIAESPALVYQAVMEPETATKPEKKERHKSQPKGSIADFNLKNRPEDYYLGYMSPEMKKKFRFALDLKYIFDHVKPTLRSSHSVKSLGNNDFHRRFVPQATNTLNTQATQEAINEDDEEMKDMLEGQNQSKDDTNTSALHSLKDITSRKDKKEEYYEKGADGVTLPFIKAKTKTFSKDEIAHALQRSGTKKGTLPRLDDESGGLYEDKKKYIPSTLRFQAAVNKNLGKGRYFVSLKGHEEDPDPAAQRKALANYKYSDKRKDYITHHDGLIRKDVDSKIENLVHKLLVNKNNFSQNFGRFGNSSRLSQAK